MKRGTCGAQVESTTNNIAALYTIRLVKDHCCILRTAAANVQAQQAIVNATPIQQPLSMEHVAAHVYIVSRVPTYSTGLLQYKTVKYYIFATRLASLR
eukprot:352525-Chlamydomonas_euryale.AAC.4